MFMPKSPVSVTLDVDNLIWLRGRMARRKRRSLSEALDEIVTAARVGATGVEPSRSVAGTIRIADEDPGLQKADAWVRGQFDRSLSRPLVVREAAEEYRVKPRGVTRALGAKRRGRRV
jgi:hypothetical protein